MVKVGKVYRNDGNINLKEVKWDIKLRLLFTYILENSRFLNMGTMKAKIEEEKLRQQKIKEYTDAFAYHMLLGKFKNHQKFVASFDSEDFEIVDLVLKNPMFLQYRTNFVELNHNLKELGAYVHYVVEIERLI